MKIKINEGEIIAGKETPKCTILLVVKIETVMRFFFLTKLENVNKTRVL